MLREFKAEKVLVGRISKGADLYGSIEAFCVSYGIRQAWVHALGAVSELAFHYYDQDKRKYKARKVRRKLEIVNCTGNVTLKDKKPFPHLHVTCADRHGRTVGGHLARGTKVFSCEVMFVLLTGKTELVRELDPQTGLHLWKV